MRILHTADLHLGQVLYQNYERADEHAHFFDQLEAWCRDLRPDALIVAGDVFDVQQPSAAMWKMFTDRFVRVHEAAPQMAIVITAGNHDSPSRLQSNSSVWRLASARLVGTPPPLDPSLEPGWEERYVVALEAGYIIALPFMTGERTATLQALLDYVAERNTDEKPVVMVGHTAVTGCDTTGHDDTIGRVRTQGVASFGTGYDYLALGHIHRPQSLTPRVRYAGSALHVSHDEQYPHTVSLVEIDRHGSVPRIEEKRIDELRHFYTLPLHGAAFDSGAAALEGLQAFISEGYRGYFRFRMASQEALPVEFDTQVNELIEPYDEELRYNRRHVWEGEERVESDGDEKQYTVPDLQQMSDPLTFLSETIDHYPGITLADLDAVRDEIEAEVRRMGEAPEGARRKKKA